MPRKPRAEYEITARDRTKRALDSASKRLKSVSSRLGKLGAASGAAAAVLGGVMITNSLKVISAQGKMARSLDISAESAVGLTTAFRTVGLEGGDVADALNTIADRAQDAVDGTQSMVDDFGLVGLKVEDLRNKNPAELFRTFAQAVSETDDVTRRNAAVIRTLGDDLGRNLLPLLQQGAEGFSKFNRQAEQLGLTFSNLDAREVEKARDAMRRIGFAVEGVSRQLAIQLAPIIEAVAEQMLGVGDDSVTMRDRVVTAVDGVAGGIGTVLDILHKWETAQAAIRVGAFTMSSGVVVAFDEIVSAAAGVFNAIVQGILNPIKTNLRILSTFSDTAESALKKIEGLRLDPDFSNAVNSQLEGMKQAVEAFNAQLDEPLPSEQIEKWLNKVRSASREAAEEAAGAQRSATTGALPSVDVGGGQSQDEETKKQRDKLQDRLDNVRQHLMSRRELEVQAFDQRVRAVQTAFENDLIPTEREKFMLIEQLTKQHEEKLTNLKRQGEQERASLEKGGFATLRDARAEFNNFEEQSNKQRVKSTLSAAEAVASGMATQSRAAFETQKQLATAQAIIKGIEAVQSSYAWGASWGGPPGGAAMAAIAAAFTATKVQAIQSQQFQGAAASSGGGGQGTGVNPNTGAPQSPVSQVQQDQNPEPGNTIIIQGDVYDSEKLAENLAKVVGDKDIEIVPRNSRNAREIRRG